MTPDELRSKWIEVDALRIAQTALARDLVTLRRTAADLETMGAVADLKTAFEVISRQLAEANLAYYEARAAFEAQPRPEPHSHPHSH
jgi:hypothetical protein